MFQGSAPFGAQNCQNFTRKIIKNIKKINENAIKIPQNFLGAFGAEVLKSDLSGQLGYVFFCQKKSFWISFHFFKIFYF